MLNYLYSKLQTLYPKTMGRPCTQAWGCERGIVLWNDKGFLLAHIDHMTEA